MSVCRSPVKDLHYGSSEARVTQRLVAAGAHGFLWTMSSDGSDDEDYDAYMETHHTDLDAKRFPVHDACEFDSLEALKVRRPLHSF